MNYKKVWRQHDDRIDDLRRRMAIERELFKKKYPNSRREDAFLVKFKDEAFALLSEGLKISSSGLKRKV